MTNPSFNTRPNPSEYVKNRTRDAIALSHEIQEATDRKTGHADLGYVIVTSKVSLLRKGESLKFDSPDALQAYILQCFW